jgi:hypothetical protein
MTIQECGMSDAVLETLAQCSDRAAGDIKASFLVYNHLLNLNWFWPFGLFVFYSQLTHIVLFYRPDMSSYMGRKLRVLLKKFLNLPKWKISTVIKIWMQHWIPLTISFVGDV